MAYEDDGYLTTDARDDSDEDDSILWSTESDWDDAQDSEDVEIDGDSFQLATGTLLVDDFEDQDLAEYDGDTGYYQIVDNPTAGVIEGNWCLEAEINSGSAKAIASLKGDGLDNYPEPGDTFRCWFAFAGSSTNPKFAWASQGYDTGEDGYYAEYLKANNAFRLTLREGTNNVLASDTVDLSADTWYEVEVYWGSDGDMTCDLFDEDGTELSSVSATDTTYTDGGINFIVNNTSGSNDTAWFDHYRLV